MDAEKTGKLIRMVRSEKGISQKELAEKIHVSNAAVSKWENGHGFPDISSLESLSLVLEISLAELIRGERWETMEVRSEEMVDHENQNQMVKDIIQLSENEMEKKNKVVRRMLNGIMAVIALVGCILLFYIWDTQNQPILDTSQKMGLLVFIPLGLGLAAWILGGVVYFRSETMDHNTAGILHALSFLCCAAAMWFPVLQIDLRVRVEDYSSIYDLSAFYNNISLFLLVSTVLINLAAFVEQRYKKN